MAHKEFWDWITTHGSRSSWRYHKTVCHHSGDSLGCNPFPVPSCLYISTHPPTPCSRQPRWRHASVFLFLFVCVFLNHVSEKWGLWDLPLLHSWLKQEISILRCSAFCCAEKGRHSLNIYIFGNFILQRLKGYNTWRKTNANKKIKFVEFVYDSNSILWHVQSHPTTMT